MLLFGIRTEGNSYLPSNDQHSLEISLRADQELDDALIAALPASCSVGRVTFEGDCFIQPAELSYILGLSQGSSITRQQFLHGIQALKYKNKFASMRCQFNEHDQQTDIHITLQGLWTFGKVSFKGLLSGNDAYRHYYSLESGEPFDYEKHRHALQKIEEAFKKEGYFNGRVFDYLAYDRTTKTVDVSITLDRGYCFLIDDVQFTIESTAANIGPLVYLKKKLQQQFGSHLNAMYCTHGLLSKQGKNIQYYLAKKGFLNTDLRVEQQFDFDSCTVSLHFFITVGTVKNFVFFGNRFFSNKQLLNIIFVFGRSAGLLPETILRQEIIDAYKKKGILAGPSRN